MDLDNIIWILGSFLTLALAIYHFGKPKRTRPKSIRPVLENECLHEELFFGSGDYYLICRSCHRYWVMTNPAKGDVPWPEGSNIGKASWLSDESRYSNPESRAK